MMTIENSPVRPHFQAVPLAGEKSRRELFRCQAVQQVQLHLIETRVRMEWVKRWAHCDSSVATGRKFFSGGNAIFFTCECRRFPF
jgi:hypothetical protein